MSLTLPQPHDVIEVAAEDGARFPLRRHGNPGGARLFLSHGNGFAIDGYFPFWSLLLGGFEIVVFDFRNHGRNPASDPAHHTYARMARDIDAILAGADAAWGHKARVGGFHSMSGRAAMKHAVEIAWRWDALVLFDPPNMPPPGHPLREQLARFERRLTEWALARRAHFADPDELARDYLASRAAANWVEGTHALMARAVLRRDGDGWTLACPPALEAAIYREALDLNLWPKASDFAGPVLLIGADPAVRGEPSTGLVNEALARENGYDYVVIKGAGHLLQVEKPQAVAEAVVAFVAKHRITA